MFGFYDVDKPIRRYNIPFGLLYICFVLVSILFNLYGVFFNLKMFLMFNVYFIVLQIKEKIN